MFSPLTKWKRHFSGLQAGDLIACHLKESFSSSNANVMITPGVIIKPDHNPDTTKTIALLYGDEREKGIKKYLVKFRYPNWIVDAEELQDRNVLKFKLQEFIEKYHKSFNYAEMENLLQVWPYHKLIWENSFNERMLAINGDPVKQFAAHTFLYNSHTMLMKDRSWSSTQGGPYFRRSFNDNQILQEALAVKPSEQLREALQNIHTESHLAQRLPEAKIVLNALRVLTASGPKNYSESPILKHFEGLLGMSLGFRDAASIYLRDIPESIIPPPALQIHHPGYPATTQMNEKNSTPNANFNSHISGCNREVYNGPSYSIDPKNTVDVDDAISFSDGWLHVHIADPTPYFPLGSNVDKEARERIASTYFTDQKFSMLARSITSQFSLSKSCNVLTFSAKVNPENGTIEDFKVRPVKLEQSSTLTDYSEANNRIPKDTLNALMKITNHHLAWRKSNGMKTFMEITPNIRYLSDKSTNLLHHYSALTDLPVLDDLNPDHKLLCENLKRENDALHKMISESMIIAGRIACDYALRHDLPLVYTGPENDGRSTVVVDGDTTKNPIAQNYTQLMTLKASTLSWKPMKHDTMGLSSYARVTSPLRRYSDQLTHRQLHSHLNNSSANNVPLMDLMPIARHERYIRNAQRANQKYWAHRYLKRLLQHPDYSVLNSQEGFKAVVITEPKYEDKTMIWLEALSMVLATDLHLWADESSREMIQDSLANGTRIRIRIGGIDLYQLSAYHVHLINNKV